MNEELVLAIEELRKRPSNRAWFIPVLLSECTIPDRTIGAGDTLNSIQQVALYKDWNDGIRRIVSVVAPELAVALEPINSQASRQDTVERLFPPVTDENIYEIAELLIAEANYIAAQAGRDFAEYAFSKDQVDLYLEGAEPPPEEVLTQLKNLEKKYGVPVNILKYVDKGHYYC